MMQVGRIEFAPNANAAAGALPNVPTLNTATVLPKATPIASHCTNDKCPDYVGIGRRRYVGELLPGCRAQCRKCGTWVQG